MGKMTSVKLADGKPTDYSTENQSKYQGVHNTESQVYRGKELKANSIVLNIPDHHGRQYRSGSMATQAQIKDTNMISYPSTNQKLNMVEQSKINRRSNWSPGFTQPEHHEVPMKGIQKSDNSTPSKLIIQNNGLGVMNANKQVSAGNIGAPHEKYDFKTVNQERLLWIQPKARLGAQ